MTNYNKNADVAGKYFDSREFKNNLELVLDVLQELYDMDLWMVTRKVGNDWIMLATVDKGYGVDPGDIFDWRDSFCCNMVKGDGPMVAPNSESIECYKNAAVNKKLPIKSYVGVPIRLDSGELFGTLCAIHPVELTFEAERDLPFVKHYASLLGRLFTVELKLWESRANTGAALSQNLIDNMTGLGNRAGWDNACETEAEMSRQLGEYLTVVMIDLDGLKQVNDGAGHSAGDQLILAAAETLRKGLRNRDYLARIGGDEFAAILIGANAEVSESVVRHIKSALENASIEASIGCASYDFKGELTATIAKADEMMYANKRAKKALAA